MIKPLVAGNWKMNGSQAFARSLTQDILKYSENLLTQIDIAVFPPSIYLASVANIVADSTLAFGLQNIASTENGAFTGELSASMAKDFNCAYALVGHSERRTLFNETNQVVANKCKLLIQSDITAILCVGETLFQWENALTEQVVADQVLSVISTLNEAQIAQLIIAYEPVWAIGTGKTATPEQAQAVHAHIRKTVATISPLVASKLRILYGGSVKPDNARTLFAQPDINGGLIGGASLKIDAFMAICKAAG